MAGAARFLYGLALGISLGIIGSKLASAASSGSQRRSGGSSHLRAAVAAPIRKEERQKAIAR
jgi:hypothetical protein